MNLISIFFVTLLSVSSDSTPEKTASGSEAMAEKSSTEEPEVEVAESEKPVEVELTEPGTNTPQPAPVEEHNSAPARVDLQAPTEVPIESPPTDNAEKSLPLDSDEVSLPKKEKWRVLVLGSDGSDLSEAVGRGAIVKWVEEHTTGEVWTAESAKLHLTSGTVPARACGGNAACLASWVKLVDADAVIEVALTTKQSFGKHVTCQTKVELHSEGKTIALRRDFPQEQGFISYVISNDIARLLKEAPVDGWTPVHISSHMEGAELTVDGVRNGKPPVELKLTPGAHTLVMTAPGFEPSSRSINVEQGIPQKLWLDPFESRFPMWTVAAGLGGATLASFATWSIMALYTSDLYGGGLLTGIGLRTEGDNYLESSPTTTAELAERSAQLRVFGAASDAVGLLTLGLALSTVAVGSYAAYQLWQEE